MIKKLISMHQEKTLLEILSPDVAQDSSISAESFAHLTFLLGEGCKVQKRIFTPNRASLANQCQRIIPASQSDSFLKSTLEMYVAMDGLKPKDLCRYILHELQSLIAENDTSRTNQIVSTMQCNPKHKICCNEDLWSVNVPIHGMVTLEGIAEALQGLGILSAPVTASVDVVSPRVDYSHISSVLRQFSSEDEKGKNTVFQALNEAIKGRFNALFLHTPIDSIDQIIRFVTKDSMATVVKGAIKIQEEDNGKFLKIIQSLKMDVLPDELKKKIITQLARRSDGEEGFLENLKALYPGGTIPHSDLPIIIDAMKGTLCNTNDCLIKLLLRPIERPISFRLVKDSPNLFQTSTEQYKEEHQKVFDNLSGAIDVVLTSGKLDLLKPVILQALLSKILDLVLKRPVFVLDRDSVPFAKDLILKYIALAETLGVKIDKVFSIALKSDGFFSNVGVYNVGNEITQFLNSLKEYGLISESTFQDVAVHFSSRKPASAMP